LPHFNSPDAFLKLEDFEKYGKKEDLNNADFVEDYIQVLRAAKDFEGLPSYDIGRRTAFFQNLADLSIKLGDRRVEYVGILPSDLRKCVIEDVFLVVAPHGFPLTSR